MVIFVFLQAFLAVVPSPALPPSAEREGVLEREFQRRGMRQGEGKKETEKENKIYLHIHMYMPASPSAHGATCKVPPYIGSAP
jgi:hypothetical protein